MSSYPWRSLVELAQNRAVTSTNEILFRFLSDESKKESILTYEELDARARKIAGILQVLGNKGDRVVIFCNPGLDYIASFFGCLYGGMIAVPAYPPKFKRNYNKILKMFQNCGAKTVLASSSILAAVKGEIEKDSFFSTLNWLDASDIPAEFAGNWTNPDINTQDLAFLQYTSGSTSDPKGVMVTHGNLLSNLEAIYQKFGETENSKGVIWLPPYHDMGLIGGILEPLYGGFETVLMSPFAFVQNPYMWLEAISKYGATTSGGPNFAYELCVERITAEEKERLDLSKWRVAFNGAEPVRQSTLELFSDTFAECGFQRQAFYTCYGLAEATLLVTGIAQGKEPETICVDEDSLSNHIVKECSKQDGKQMVSCGSTFEGENICIVDPITSTPCHKNAVGEIWVKSPCIAKGYWNMEEQTKEVFQAYIGKEGPFMRTGDLGFLKGSELYLTGRYKDLIIIRGKNYYPQDIELAVEKSHEAFVPNSGVAFSVENGEEETLVVVYEIKKNFRKADLQEIYHKARKSLLEHFELPMDSMVFVRQMSLPKTSSGKVQRNLSRMKYLSGELNIIGEMGKAALETIKEIKEIKRDSQDSIFEYLSSLTAACLKIEESTINFSQPMNEYGFDSISAVHFVHQIESELKINLSMELLFNGITLEELSQKIEEQLKEAKTEVSEENWEDKKSFSLSGNQQSIYFMEKLSRDKGVFNLAFMVRLTEDVDVDLLNQAFEKLGEYNACMRTRFFFEGTEAIQSIEETEVLDFKIQNIDDTDEKTFRHICSEESLKAFDLEKEPLIRVRIFQKTDGTKHMLVVMHHLITDFWSITIMVKELALIYSDLLDGKNDYRKHLSGKISYYAFVQEQKKILHEKPELLAYWKKRLAGELPVLNLNTDFNRPAVQSYKGDSVFQQFDIVLTERIKEFCTENGITVFMFLFGVYHLMLRKYTGQNKILTGTLTSGRRSEKFSNICGYFVNPVALCMDLTQDISFGEYMGEVRKTVLEAFAHQDYPFASLVEQLQGKRDLGRSPVFQNMFIYQNSQDSDLSELNAFALNETSAKLQMGQLCMELEPMRTQRVQYDITMISAELKNGIGISLQYNTDLFKKETIRRMAQHYKTLTENILEHADSSLSGLSMLGEEEENTLLNEWNQTEMKYDVYALHRLVEKQAQQTPERTAAIFSGKQITYEELDKKANQFANYLLKQGLTKEGSVALCIERSLNMVICLLAILKAGGYYIPLDPTHPKERLAFIVEDAGQNDVKPIVITQNKYQEYFSAIEGNKICLEEDKDKIEQESIEAPNIAVEGKHLAYTIYTSGSTGKPKGVQISHKAAVNFMLSMAKEPGMKAEDVLLSVTTISFDIAGLEIFLPLICGAKVIIAQEEIILDGKKLIEIMQAEHVSVMQGTPSIWRILLEAGWKGTKNLKILCGGEAFPVELAEQLLDKAGEVWNMYGPTETTIWSTVYKIESVHSGIPIGHPIANTLIYILDEAQRPVPIGVTGELYIGGDGLARGYYNRPELTEEKFLPNPFQNKKDGRIYRTGDLARYGQDGMIEYLGRMDHQVKVRGYRIETGEIESVMNTQEQVQTSLVVAKENKAGITQLIAYLIPESQADFNVSVIRRFLKEKLPEYMIPSYFVLMEKFPQTPNGKIDRKALPEPEYGRPEMETEYKMPSSQTEELIAQVWKEILGLERIGVKDNFFELGGNSMLMVKIQHKLSELMPEHEIGIVELFQYPTVSAFAEYIAGSVPSDISTDKQIESHIGKRKERSADAEGRRNQRKQLRTEEKL